MQTTAARTRARTGVGVELRAGIRARGGVSVGVEGRNTQLMARDDIH